MAEGAPRAGEAVLVLRATPPEPPGARVFRGSHPLPDAASLRAGEAFARGSAGAAARRRRAPADLGRRVRAGGSAASRSLAGRRARGEPGPAPLRRAHRGDELRAGAPLPAQGRGVSPGPFTRRAFRGRARSSPSTCRWAESARSPAGRPSAIRPPGADALELAREYALPQAATRVRETLKPGDPADFIEHEAICDLRSPRRRPRAAPARASSSLPSAAP